MAPRPRKPSLKRSGAPPSSQISPNSRIFRDPADMRRKKVKFADSSSILEVEHEQDISSLQTERIESPSFGGAKTFEYRYFSKLWEETGHKHSAYQPPALDIHLNAVIARDGVKELQNSVKYKANMNTSPLPILKVTPMAQTSYNSPPKVLGNCELNSTVTGKDDATKSTLLVHSITPVSQLFSSTDLKDLQNSGPKYEHEGTFSKKRSKLIQLATGALSLEINEFQSNRSDLLWGLLQRLGVGRKSRTCEEFSKSEQKIYCGRNHSPASSQSYCLSEELHDPVGTEFVATTARKHIRKDLLAYRSREADELIALPWHYSEVQDFQSLHNKRQSNWVLNETGNSVLQAQDKSVTEMGMETGYSKYAPHDRIMHCMSSGDIKASETSSCCHFGERSLVPYISSTFSEPSDLNNEALDLEIARDQQSPRWLCWNYSIEEPKSPVSSHSVVPMEMVPLPLTLFTASNFLDETNDSRFLDGHGWRGFSYSRTPNFEAVLRDTPYRFSDDLPSTPKHGFEFEWKSSPIDFGRDHCSSVYSELQSHGEITRGRLDCSSSGSRSGSRIDERIFTEFQRHHSGALLSQSNIPYLGFEFSLDRKAKMFTLLPDRLS